MGTVVSKPWTTLAALSPTSTTSIPAPSRMRANEKSYAVSIAIFSPRAFISARRAVVTLRRLEAYAFEGVSVDIRWLLGRFRRFSCEFCHGYALVRGKTGQRQAATARVSRQGR